MVLNFKNVPSELEFAVSEASARFNFTLGAGEPIEIKKIEKGLAVEKNLICYSSISTFLRALNIFLSGGKTSGECAFDEFGVMLDLSRNAVAKLDTIKQYAFTLASMGYNELKLYTEDTYEVQNQPYFGYMRGALTASELKQADSYCAQIGIELILCIQTLAHLNLSRYSCYAQHFDCNDILLAGDERTYKLIDDMFASLAFNLKTRKVNIGMDEAHMLGLGKYLDIHGYTKRFDIMTNHLKRVLEIADKYGFKCEMWSDMFFRLLSGGGYCGDMAKMPQEVIDNLPKNVTLVYWDYYSLDYNHYDEMLKNHFMLTKNVAFAGGAWKWSGFLPDNTYSLEANTQNIKACKKYNIKNYFLTSWGDNGAEASHFSVLPALFDASQKAFGDDDYSSFKNITGITFDEFMQVDSLDKLSVDEKYNHTNPTKYMLYNDSLQGLFDNFCDGASKIYEQKLPALESIAKKDFKYNYIFANLVALGKVLILKAELGIKIKKAYDAKDSTLLKSIATNDMPQTIERVKEFYQAFKKQWTIESKPFGFEVQAVRIGGLIQRLSDIMDTLRAYLKGEITQIPELEIERKPFDNSTATMDTFGYNNWITNITTAYL